jgi:hypothetical protein
LRDQKSIEETRDSESCSNLIRDTSTLGVIEQQYIQIDQSFPYGLTAKMLADQGLDISILAGINPDTDLASLSLNLGQTKTILKEKNKSEVEAIFEDI